MIPEARLQSLVEQALDRQLERCLFHNVRKPMVSLLCDYQCGREQIPSVVCQVRLCSQVYKLELRCQQHRMQSLCIIVDTSPACSNNTELMQSCARLLKISQYLANASSCAMLVVCLTQQTMDSISQKCQATQVHVHSCACQGDACGHDDSFQGDCTLHSFLHW